MASAVMEEPFHIFLKGEKQSWEQVVEQLTVKVEGLPSWGLNKSQKCTRSIKETNTFDLDKKNCSNWVSKWLSTKW
jgi:hypothetical protein